MSNRIATITLPPENAALIAAGVQTIITTATKPTKVKPGDRLLIHAGMRPAHPDGHEFADGCVIDLVDLWLAIRDDDVETSFEPGAWTSNNTHYHPIDPGHIVASCVLRGRVPIVAPDDDRISSSGSMIVTHGHKAWFYPEDTTSQGHTVKDQLPFGDFTPGRWAWLLDDVKTTTERCPACWGDGDDHERIHSDCTPDDDWYTCRYCKGVGTCPPIPWRGGPGIRWWEP